MRTKIIALILKKITMKKIKIFLLGMYEFKRNVTTHFDNDYINVYDWGREIAHRLTFRKFDTLLLALILIISSYAIKAQDTILVKKFVYVQFNKYHPPHKVRCKYIIFHDGKYYVNGRQLHRLYQSHLN